MPLVVGCGFAGGAAAITAHDQGARTLVLEKMPDPGGISVCSAGSVRVAQNADDAFDYLQATCAGTTPDEPLRPLAEGMTEISEFVESLAAAVGAQTQLREAPGTYPFPGQATFGYFTVENVPDFDPANGYPQVRGMPGGGRLFNVVDRNLRMRGIEVRTNSPVTCLIANQDVVVEGVIAGCEGKTQSIRACRGVILACGGFEANPDMQKQFWQGKPVVSTASPATPATASAWRRIWARISGTCGTITGPMVSGSTATRSAFAQSAFPTGVPTKARPAT